MTADVLDRFLETVVMTLYGFAFSPREEYLLLSLFDETLKLEISKAKKVGSFLNNNPVLPKMITKYARRAQGKKFCQDVLFNKILSNIISDKELNLELNAVKILRDMITKEEMRTGVKSKVDVKSLTYPKAMEDENVARLIEERKNRLIEICQSVLDGLSDHVSEFPFGLRWVCKRLNDRLNEKHPDSTEAERASVIGYMAFYRFINPPLVSPDAFELTTKKISITMRNNLVTVSKVLTSLTSNVLFDPKIEEQMVIVNDWLKSMQQTYIEKFIRPLLAVGDPEEELGVSEFTELTQKKTPKLTISWGELLSTKQLLDKYRDNIMDGADAAVTTSPGAPPEASRGRDPDGIGELLDQIGDFENHFEGDLNEEITLMLTPPKALTESAASAVAGQTEAPSKQYERVKDDFRFVLRTIPSDKLGDNVLETLRVAKDHAGVLAKQQPAGAKPQQQTAEGASSDGKQAQTDAVTEESMPPAELAQRIVARVQRVEEALPAMEAHGFVSESNKYRQLLVDLAKDVQNAKNIRDRQRKELERLRESLKALESHHGFLKTRQKEFDEYIADCRLKHFQSGSDGSGGKKKKKGKRSGASEKHKFTFKQLKEKGVIKELNVMKSQQGRISFVISMHEPGQFEVTAQLAGMSVKRIDLALDELLDKASRNIDELRFDNVTLDVNMLLHVLNQLFAGGGGKK